MLFISIKNYKNPAIFDDYFLIKSEIKTDKTKKKNNVKHITYVNLL